MEAIEYLCVGIHISCKCIYTVWFSVVCGNLLDTLHSFVSMLKGMRGKINLSW